ncbi:MAG: hypothetical protein GYB31_09255 [Bacteroidetes bacterium]|nr:hypothetical protein [Bacteroidota bacterium]
MRKFLCMLPLFLIAFAMNAQEVSAVEVNEQTEALQQVYNLSDQQVVEMQKIQERKLRNLASIQNLKEENQDLYYQKLKAIQYNTDISIQRLLNSDQMKIFYERSVDRRQRQAELARKLQDQGATPTEIERALIEME